MAFTGPLVGFDLGGAERAQAFLSACSLVAEATSFGGVHSTAERRGRWGTDDVGEGFIRFSAGCEDTEDLLGRRCARVGRGATALGEEGGEPPGSPASASSPELFGLRLNNSGLDVARAPHSPPRAVDVRPARLPRPGANRPPRDLTSPTMPRPTTVHVCSACGAEAPRWLGQCPGCGEWNTLVEEQRAAPAGKAGRGGAAPPRAAAARPIPLSQVQAVRHVRHTTGIKELDRVLGGGLVPGSLVLIGGSPGIGKSTLTSMALGNLQGAGKRTLYVSGEESAAQIRLRAERLPGAALEVPTVAETDLETVLATLEQERPEVCVIDSVQTLHAADLTGAAGSVGQVREVADRITRLAKARDIAVLLVGHVTKEGALAGPRVLEHLVDCVLQFEGERERTYRTLRALKNRFGSTNEVGVFEMRQGGLVEVEDASARFVGEATRAPGSAVLAAMEGSGRCWSRSRRSCRPRSWSRRGGSATASTATAWRSCWRCSPATPASPSAARTSSSASPAASASTSPGRTSRSPWPWPARPGGCRSAATPPSPWRASARSA